MSAAIKISRRQRLDEEYLPLLDINQVPLCFYGPSLITVIFNAQTIVDATLFFIAGAHQNYRFTSTPEHPDVVDVRFVRPRIPTFFNHLLPEGDDSSNLPAKRPRHPRSQAAAKPTEEGKKRTERARKRCAFFTVLVTRRGRGASEPALVQLSADVKLFHYTAHVCGLRDARDAEIVMFFIHQAFVANQERLDSEDPVVLNELAGGDDTRRAFLDSNNKCCTIPLEVSEGDVVMTNICGRFPKTLNLRKTYRALSTNYPGVLTYLTTMSKSNYLAVSLFEHAPFTPIRSSGEMGAAGVSEVVSARHAYLMSSKKVRSKLRKHTFFIYASGRFIQSSRNNATALRYSEQCMMLLHTVTEGAEPPTLVEDDEVGTEPGVEEDEESVDLDE